MGKSSRVLTSIFSLCVLTLYSCGKGPEEKLQDSIVAAADYLSVRDCQKAIDLLEAAGLQSKNAQYLKTLASAYACKAGYSTLKLFSDDLAKTADPQPIGGMSTYSTSLTVTSHSMNVDASYIQLQKAIDLLLYAGDIPLDTDPTSDLRKSIFGKKLGEEINSQVTFMLMVQLGKFLRIYGNTNNDGEKGLGTQTNFCFTNYEDVNLGIQNFILNSGQTGACTTLTGSHPDFEKNVADRKENLCKGLVLINQISALLPDVAGSAAGGDLDVVADFLQTIDSKKTQAITAYPAIESTLEVLSQKKCEDATDIDLVTLASAYAFFYEALVL